MHRCRRARGGVAERVATAGESLHAVRRAGRARGGAGRRRLPGSRRAAHVLSRRMQEPAGWRAARLFEGATLKPGACIDGPAIVAERNATVVVEPGWQAQLSAAGHLELRRVRARAQATAASIRAGPGGCDPVMLEVFNNLFMNIAEQMGLRLQNTAHSVNIKERLDFSCALFDAAGALIANAPHMPVHLGSMSESIRAVMLRNPPLKPGEVYVLNDPYHGGTHLPDVTVVTPVFLKSRRYPSFFVASRGHHADIGGITPGSMPPFSTRSTKRAC